MKKEFQAAIDQSGNSMEEVSRRYWDDPNYADKVRAEIAERKRRGH